MFSINPKRTQERNLTTEVHPLMHSQDKSSTLRSTSSPQYERRENIANVPLNQRPRQHGRRIVFNDHNQQSQTNKQFDLKYKETTLALGHTNIQNKREINWNSTKNLLL